MSVVAMSRFFALLAILANVCAIVLFVARLAHSRPLGRRIIAGVRDQTLWLAWLVATVSTAGSLYYSEIAGFTPCRLCWVQRGFMYPLVIVLGIAAWRNAVRVRRFVIPWVLLGAGVSTYHYLEQHFPSLDAGACSVTNPCSAAWVWEFGFLSIPYMALSGFLVIAALLLIANRPTTPPAAAPSTPTLVSTSHED